MRANKKAVLVILSVLVLAAALSALLLLVVAPRVLTAGEKPSWFEAFLAREIRRLAVPDEMRDLNIPFEPTVEDLAAARAHWVGHCALCHGLDGSGDTDLGRNLYPPTPDLRAASTQQLSDGELFHVISHGVRLTGMPTWGKLHTERENWQLVAFIRRLPAMGQEELEDMRRQAAGETDSYGHQHAPGSAPHTH